MIRILHVDDEPDFLELAGIYLERADDRFDVAAAPSAAAALDRLDDGGFDCVISDYQMPEMDGLEFLAAVREGRPELPFVLFTGKGSEEIASEAISAGVTDYLQKGAGSDQYTVLANRVANAVERHRAVRRSALSDRAMETTSEGISLVEADGTFSYVNAAFAELFGYDRDELVGEHWTILYHDGEADRLEHDILPAVPETGYWSGETVRLTKDGDRLVTDHRLAHTDEGVIVCTAQDVTAERSDPDTAGSIDRLVAAIEGHAFYTLDHEGYVTRWNEAAARVIGYEAAEVLGAHLATFFTEEDRAAGLPERLLERASATGSATDDGWRLRKDGSRFRADETIAASFDAAGTLRGFGSVTRETG